MKFKDAVEEYLEYVKSMLSDGTYRCYKCHKNFPVQELGEMKVKNINQKVILKYIDSQRKRNPEIKNITINKQLKVIRQTYNYIMKKPLNIGLLKEARPTIKTISKETIDKIFTHFELNLYTKYNFRNYVYFRLLIETGLWLNEMNNILVKNIDFNDRSILVETTKTDVNRYVFFSEETSKLIQELIDRYELTKYLFVNFEEESPTPISVSAIENMIRRLKVKLNIKENISPHKWRHTFATKFARSNGNMEALRQILGHDNLKTTQKYLHLNKKDIMNAYNDVLDKLTA